MTTFRKMKNKPNAATSTLIIMFILNFFFGYCTSQLYEGSTCELGDGSLGICKSISLCMSAMDAIAKRKITPADLIRCSFEGSNVIICCEDERPTSNGGPNVDPWSNGNDDDGIFFDDRGFSFSNNRLPQPTSPAHTLFNRLVNITIENPLSTSRGSVRTSTMYPPRVTTTTRRSTTSVTTQRTRSTSRFITQPTISSSTQRTRIVTTKPTVNPFWAEWAPTNQFDVDVFSGTATNSIDNLQPQRQNSTSSKLVMSPFLQSMLNEAIAGNNMTTTTQRSRNQLDNGERNNDLSFSRPNPTPPNRNTPPPVSPTRPARPPSRIGQRRSEIACENYTTLSSPLLSFNILGGVPTALGEFPHMAALGFPSQEFGGNEFDFNCGASIISENWVLTAAHCVTDRNLPTVVRSGKITLLTNDDGVPGITSTIAEIIPHPNYTPSRRYDDIALIRVSSPIVFDENTRPACLRSNMSDIEPDVQLTVTGWGRTSVQRAERSNALLKTNLTGVTLESCNASLLGYNANDRSLRNGVNLGQICAYDPQARQDSCEGDSGGPLQIYSPNGMSTVVGVTSFGISCGSALPSVYARVAFYLDWIESIVWPNR